MHQSFSQEEYRFNMRYNSIASYELEEFHSMKETQRDTERERERALREESSCFPFALMVSRMVLVTILLKIGDPICRKPLR
jgi:hypothetical protein